MADTDLTGNGSGAVGTAADADPDWHLVLVRGPSGNGQADLQLAPAAVDDTRVTPAPPKERMQTGPRILIGIWLAVFSALVLAHLLWVWSFTARLVSSPTPSHIRVHWLWLEFTPTVDWALVLLVVFAAAAGSAAHLSLVFSNRYGLKTLERTWTWWYVLRPGAAAIVGVVAYVVLKAGFLGTVTDQDQNSIAFAAAVGTLAGMFTDTLVGKLRGALGASPFERATATGGADPGNGATGGPPPPADGKTGAPATIAPDSANPADAVGSPPAQATTTEVPSQPAPEATPPERLALSDPRLAQTDNRPRPEDGDQDVDQHPLPYPGSPAGPEGLDEGGGRS